MQPESASSTPLVRCREISKFFGGVKALDRISLDLFPAQITALLGDNGAGKSTLVKVLNGLHTPDEGELWLGENQIDKLTTGAARAFGIETVHQHLSLCDNLGAAANVMLGQEPIRWKCGPLRMLNERKAAEEARRRIAEVGVVLEDMTSPVRRLSGGQRQAIAIARALVNAHHLILFDEPTAALGIRQTQATLDLIRRVANQGVGVILISHNLDDVFAVAHRLIVLRQGRVVLDAPAHETPRERVVAAMTGIAFASPYP